MLEKVLDISFTLEDKNGPYFGFIGLKGNLVTSGNFVQQEKAYMTRFQKKEIRKTMKNIIEESNGIKMIDFYDRGNCHMQVTT